MKRRPPFGTYLYIANFGVARIDDVRHYGGPNGARCLEGVDVRHAGTAFFRATRFSIDIENVKMLTWSRSADTALARGKKLEERL